MIPAEADDCNRIQNWLGNVMREDCRISYRHRTIHDFIAHKIADGTLETVAGASFDPSVTTAQILVRLSKMANFDSSEGLEIMRNFARCADRTGPHSAALRIEW